MTVLSACSLSDFTPYYPEPFGNYDYHRGPVGAEECRTGYDSGYDSATPVGFSPLFKGAVGFRPNPIVDICSIGRYQRVQNHYLQLFYDMSQFDPSAELRVVSATGTTNAPVDEEDASPSDPWFEITKNGMNYIDGVCEDYLRQLYRLKKNTKGLKTLTVNTGYTAAQIVGNTLINSTDAGRVLAILGAAFGLGSTIFDIYDDTILIKADYSAVYRMVRLLRSSLRTSMNGNIGERSDAVKYLQTYLFVCTPHAIESAINTKIGAESDQEVLTALGLQDVPTGEEKKLIELVEAIVKGGGVRPSIDPSGNVTFINVSAAVADQASASNPPPAKKPVN